MTGKRKMINPVPRPKTSAAAILNVTPGGDQPAPPPADTSVSAPPVKPQKPKVARNQHVNISDNLLLALKKAALNEKRPMTVMVEEALVSYLQSKQHELPEE